MKKKISILLSIVCTLGVCSGLSGCTENTSDGGTLLWYCIGDTPEDNAQVLEKVNEIIEPKIGMKLDIKYIDTASYAGRFTVILS